MLSAIKNGGWRWRYRVTAAHCASRHYTLRLASVRTSPCLRCVRRSPLVGGRKAHVPTWYLRAGHPAQHAVRAQLPFSSEGRRGKLFARKTAAAARRVSVVWRAAPGNAFPW